jgi:hypothetical protein
MQFLGMLFLFLKLFSPMFLLIVAVKYIFDCTNRNDNGASETLRLSFAASAFAGLAVGAFYYLDAGHIIGANASQYCADGAVCLFNWGMAGLAGRMFLISGAWMMAALLSLRGIYSELSFMLKRKK